MSEPIPVILVCKDSVNNSKKVYRIRGECVPYRDRTLTEIKAHPFPVWSFPVQDSHPGVASHPALPRSGVSFFALENPHGLGDRWHNALLLIWIDVPEDS